MSKIHDFKLSIDLYNLTKQKVNLPRISQTDCILMCKDVELLRFFIGTDGITNVRYQCSESAKKLLPPHMVKSDNIENDFIEWIKDRCLPHNRQNLDVLLRSAVYPQGTFDILMLSHGMSLSDQYWLHYLNDGLTWENANFYDNSFSEIPISRLGSVDESVYLESSPIASSGGFLTKCWCRDGMGTYLLKGGSGLNLEPLSELMCGVVAKYILKSYVPYTIHEEFGKLYSKCYNLTNPNIAMQSAINVRKLHDVMDYDNGYEHLLDCIHDLTKDWDSAREFLDRLLIFDFVVNNEDRHYNNLCLLQDSNTGKYLGFAPVFDNGNSMYFDTLTEDIAEVAKKGSNTTECKPFRANHYEQIKLVKLHMYDDIITNLLTDCSVIELELFNITAPYRKYIGELRMFEIVRQVRTRIEYLYNCLD